MATTTMQFSQMFQSNYDGSISPRILMEFNGATLHPGVSFTKGTLIGGMDIAAMTDKSFIVEKKDDVTVIKGVAP